MTQFSSIVLNSIPPLLPRKQICSFAEIDNDILQHENIILVDVNIYVYRTRTVNVTSTRIQHYKPLFAPFQNRRRGREGLCGDGGAAGEVSWIYT